MADKKSTPAERRRDARYIRWAWENVKHPLEALTRWAKKKDRLRRFQALAKWAAKKQMAAKSRRARRKWKRLRIRYAHKIEALKGRRDHLDAGDFEPWMLNGRPGNVSPGTKAAIARGVAHGLYVTSTSTGGHASSSWHFPWNNRDGLGHGVDMAGSYEDMVAWQNAELARGDDLLELIGPDNDACAKNGSRYTLGEGTALESAHDNHVHRATAA